MTKDNESKPRSWQQIAAEAAMEADSDRLLQLAQELEQALEEREKRMRVSAR
jgi:hypothetical protein